MRTSRILLVEDEASLALLVKEGLEGEGYLVHHGRTGEEAIQLFKRHTPDLIILDVMMPKLNGFDAAQTIRQVDKTTPIIFLSAKIQAKDVVQGFKVGANDYIRKPFSMEELLMRVKVVLDGVQLVSNKQSELTSFPIGNSELRPNRLEVLVNNKEQVKLTARETELLRLLCINKEVLLTKESLLLSVWGSDSFINSRSLDVFISRLRKKLKSDEAIAIINVRGQGYKIVVNR
ncbi:DNA-binding response OmpR family regulator [Roseivirga pacifica]|uniref:DNA-binding response regulator, OmpR family, contains REC and winged-helix (WHTH) domain n=1 Tax=Roseivirga pacifica TaxID=1267423 RepID=A0A1I0QU09_9BACT|nr:response regulator transcription factor [Roseivirga pacifica]RKQ42613.1 DNA-binding response OmpR family regulator [Roseivirga pacifica]SEW30438.1 DNA-binding response regulator, OmpR family, contains REC and winged-helix (wHTH) domain [Roseivirga pacifica]